MAEKVIGYQILSEIDRVDLVSTVEKYIKHGWEPIGGVTVDSSGSTVVYCQAVIAKKIKDT